MNPGRNPGSSRAVVVPYDTLRLLRRPAWRRHIGVVQLAQQIIEAVARARLADAVLDDKPDGRTRSTRALAALRSGPVKRGRA